MTLYEKAITLQQILEQENKKLQKQIDSAPPGILYCSCDKNRGLDRWDLVKDGKRSYLPLSQRELAMQLAVKRLALCKLNDNKRELKAVRAYLWHHREESGAEKLLQKSPALARLAASSNPGKEWMNKPYKKNPAYSQYLTFLAPDGQMVRSKSEADIITVLIEFEIPYRYECAVCEEGKTYYPDFTIWLPARNITKYWEHFGRMDDPLYRKEAFSKVSWYIEHGIIPQKNLIISIETKDSPFTIVKARELAQLHLI